MAGSPQFRVVLDQPLLDRLKALADANRLPLSATARILIAKYFEDHDRRQARLNAPYGPL